MRLADFRPFHGVAFLVPTHNALIENFHVAVTLFLKNAVGQTGQVMGACSIQDDQSILGDALRIGIELRQRRGERAKDMRFAILFLAAHIDEHGFLSCRDLLH